MRMIFFMLVIFLCLGGLFSYYHYAFEFDYKSLEWWGWLFKVYFSPQEKPSFITVPLYLTGFCMMVGLVLVALVFSGSKASTISGGRKGKDLHGSARRAKWKDIKKAQLNSKAGVIVGGFKKWAWLPPVTLRHNGPEHILVFAPTRSGKGVSLIIPTLLTWMESALILDMKGENFALTAGFRKLLGHKVIKFEPAAAQGSHGYNPLEEIRLGTPQEIADTMNIAAMIVDLASASGKDQFWSSSGAEFLTAGILHVIYKTKIKEGRIANMVDVRKELVGSGEIDFENPDAAKEATNSLFRSMIEFDHQSDIINSEVRLIAGKMFSMADQTRTGIIQNALYALGIFADPNIGKNVKQSDFKIHDLMNGEKPNFLYLIVNSIDIDRMKPLIRIFITQVLSNLMTEMKFSDGKSVAHYKHRLLLLMDEFPAFGKMEMYENMLGYMAGYGIKSMVVVQGKMQLDKIYGENQAFFAGSSIRIAFAPNEAPTAKLISEMLGTTTILQKKTSSSSNHGVIGGNNSDSIAETSRPLLTPDEVSRLKSMEKGWFNRMKPGDMLIFKAGHPPILGRQELYFQDKILSERAKIPPPVFNRDEREPPPKLPAPQPIENLLDLVN